MSFRIFPIYPYRVMGCKWHDGERDDQGRNRRSRRCKGSGCCGGPTITPVTGIMTIAPTARRACATPSAA